MDSAYFTFKRNELRASEKGPSAKIGRAYQMWKDPPYWCVRLWPVHLLPLTCRHLLFFEAKLIFH